MKHDNKMNIQTGQNKNIKQYFPDYNLNKSQIIAEGGCDNGETFFGSFLVKIYRRGVYRFNDGKLIKKIK